MTVQRDDKGRFLPGQNPNPGGRPKERKEYMDILRSTLTPAAWRAICKKAIEQAKDGDKAARKWVAAYAIGRPLVRAQVEIDTQSQINAKLTQTLDLVYGDGEDSAQTGLPSEPS